MAHASRPDGRPRLLAVATTAPWPIGDGYALRVAHLLRELGRAWEIILIAPPTEPGWDMEDWRVARFVPVPLEGSWRTVPSQYDWRPLSLAADEAIGAFKPRAAVLWSGSEHLGFRPGFPPAVADRIDSLTLISWRAFRDARNTRARLRSLSDSWVYARYERQIVRRLKATVVVGEDDARVLRRLAGRDSVHVVPNGVALPPADVKRETPQPSVIFSGVMSYEPNVAAVRWFASSVWPQVRAAVPAARFVIAGRGASAAVASLGELPGVEVRGPVPDMLAALGAAWVAVAPMRSGAGIKNKVLEAWAAGTPVVMTRLAGNGLALDREAQQLVSDEPRELAALIVRLLENPAERRRFGSAARALAAGRHSWTSAGERLSAVLDTIAPVAPLQF